MQDSVDTQKANGLWNHVYNDSKPLAQPRRHQKKCFQGGFGDFLSSTSATRRAMTRGHGRNSNNDERPSPRGFETKFVATPLQSSSHENWHGGRFPPVPSPSYCLQIINNMKLTIIAKISGKLTHVPPAHVQQV